MVAVRADTERGLCQHESAALTCKGDASDKASVDAQIMSGAWVKGAAAGLSPGSGRITEVNCLQWSIAVIGVKGEGCA